MATKAKEATTKVTKAKAVATKITIDELKSMIEEVVDKKLQEYLRDPDEGLELREDFGKKLKASLAATHRGKRGIPLQQLANEMGVKLP